MERPKELVIKTAALDQLQEVYLYYRDYVSVNFAEKFRLNFFSTIQLILPLYNRYPICKFKKPLNKSYRQITWNKFLIIYKITERNIEILSLFHTKQNPKKLKKLLK